MKKYPYTEAKQIIEYIYDSAMNGCFDTRDKFFHFMEENPNIAIQGYNPHGKIFHWNEASANLYGHSESAACNQDLVELILPPEMHQLARDMIRAGSKTGRMPEPSACDLVRYNGDLVTVFSGHLVFRWDGGYPEFYCIDLPIEPEPVGN